MKKRVAIVSCRGYEKETVDAAARRAVGLLGGMEGFVRPGSKVLVKPNMLAAKDPDRAVTTHPELVRAVVRMVREAGGVPTIGDSQAIGGFARVSEMTGMARVAREEGVRLAPLEEAVSVRGAGTFKHFEIAREVVEADHIINLPKAKTHGQMLLTLAVKNLFGCIPGRRKVQWHFKSGVDRNAFATMLVELCGVVRPALNVVDAVVCMEGNGPGSGTPRSIGYIVAGADAPSVDVALTGMLGVQHDILPTTRAALKMGLDGADPAGIECVGDVTDPSKALVEGFKLPSTSSVEWTIPEPLRRLLKDALTTRPSVDSKACELCLECLEACPAGAISEGREAVEIRYRDCIRCFCCQEVCPIGAIEIVEGWLLKYLG